MQLTVLPPAADAPWRNADDLAPRMPLYMVVGRVDATKTNRSSKIFQRVFHGLHSHEPKHFHTSDASAYNGASSHRQASIAGSTAAPLHFVSLSPSLSCPRTIMSQGKKIGGEYGEVRATIDVDRLNGFFARHVPAIKVPIDVQQFKVRHQR